MTKFESVFEDYKKSLARFEEAMMMETSDMVRDSAIKRFELTFDLSWKLIKAFLEEEKGLVCRSPKPCFRAGFQQGILEYDDYWMKLADHRNEAVHTYKVELAEKLYREELPKALEKFKELQQKLAIEPQNAHPPQL